MEAADRGLDATRLASVESLCCAVSGGGEAEAHAAASPSRAEWLLAATAGMAIACEQTDDAQACAKSVGLATQRCSDWLEEAVGTWGTDDCSAPPSLFIRLLILLRLVLLSLL